MPEKQPEPDFGDDHVRRLVWTRMRANGFTLTDLSHAGKNLAYIHQYLFKRSPKLLPELVRESLATLLDVPEAALRGDRPPVPVAPPARKRTSLETVRDAASEIPVFGEGDVIDPAQAAEWMPRLPLFGPSGGMFALWIRSDRGRLKAGDLAFVRTSQPAGAGDLFVALAHGRVVNVGDMVRFSRQLIRELDIDDAPAASEPD